jgi:hypothetical protein
MYAYQRNFKTPSDQNVVIWRYLSFVKFASLIEKCALFFTGVRALRRIDPFEGTLTEPNLQVRQGLANEPEYANTFASWDKDFEEFLRFTVVNCWHMNPTESVAMWKLYLARGEGVAIRSTFSRLSTSFDKPSSLLVKSDGKPVDIYIGEVEYTDPRYMAVGEGYAFYRIMHKDFSFNYEHELRAVIGLQEQVLKQSKQTETVEIGIYIPVKLETLIEKVVLPPSCQVWMKELIESLLKKYEVNVDVEPSRLKIDIL